MTPRAGFVLNLFAACVLAGCEQPPIEVATPDLSKADPVVADVVRRASDHVASSGGSGEAWTEYGRVLYGNGFNEHALAAFSEALTVDPDQPRNVYVRSLVNRSNYDRPAALADALRAVELTRATMSAAEVHVLWRAAWMAMEASEFEQAADLLDRASAVAPDDANTKRVRARLHLEMGQAAEGLAVVQALVESDPANGDIRWLQSRLLRGAGRPEEAQAAALLSSERTPVYTDPWAAWAMGRRTGIGVERDRALRLAQAGQHQEADRVLRRLQSFDIEPRTLALLEARLQAAGGARGLAVASLTMLVDEYPDWAPPHHELARLMLARPAGGGRPPVADVDRAIELLEKAVELDGESTVARSTLAQAYGARRRFDDAVAQLAVCVEQVPANRGWRTAMATAQVSGGDAQAARQTLDEAATLFGGAEPPQALVTRVRANIKIGDKVAAAEALVQLQDAAPNHPAIDRLTRLVQQP
ncbi:MAG: tetratricopeptide repeat protein [Phycisphaerales bacterium]|jgi:tetratricopeptide (TPR) repeat protein|nr:tetratricopeptide repeat protein [Phycisphaerales bacterium]